MLNLIIFYRIARFLRQSFRQSIRRFRGESVEDGSQAQANIRGRQPRGKLSADLNFTAPPDYATVIIETQRHTQNNSEYGSLNVGHDVAGTSSLVSSELPLVENLQRNVEGANEQPASLPSMAPPKRDSIHSQSFR